MNKILITALAIGIVLSACEKETADPAPYIPTDPINTFFENEVTPHSQAVCALGSYYRKLASSLDYWKGISGTVTLPTTAFDSSRRNPSNNRQFLDNPSVYIGGNSNGQETDIGLTWEVIKDSVTGNNTLDRKAFRPFMRRTGFSATGQASLYANAPLVSRYYWYPGETVTMSVQTISQGVVRFIVDGAGKRFDTTFAADGFQLNSPAVYKRVNAIDQVNNEGRPVQASRTVVSNAVWSSTSLLRSYKDSLVWAPMHPGRYTALNCPDVKYITVTATDVEKKKGGETITIDAGR